MSTPGDKERERLKQEYKAHYRKIKEAKERLKSTQKKGRITQALNDMNADELLGSVDEFLGKLRDKVNLSEAKLDIAMENIVEINLSVPNRSSKQGEFEEEKQRLKAKDTLKQVKAEMGMLYSEIEKTADEIQTKKTIGTKKEDK